MGVRRGVFVLGLFVILLGSIAYSPTQPIYGGGVAPPEFECAGIIITEIMYNPSTSQGSDFTNEWIEILNDGCEDVDLSGWTLGDPVDTDPISPLDGGSTVLGPGEYALIIDGIGSDVTTNPAWSIAPETRIFGTDDRTLGNALNNSGDTITLKDDSGNIVDSVIYDDTDSSGCGNEADGKGFSLERVDPLGPSDCTNFRSMELLNNFPIGGTPGSDNHLWVGSSCICIDIKPGSDPNCFNSDGNGVIPVAILGNTGFDVSTVDPASIQLDGQDVKIKGNGDPQANIEDVNDDGLPDLVVKIIDDGIYSPGDTTATLTGQLNDGTPIEGTDSICIIQ
jgi:hypothetical protein